MTGPILKPNEGAIPNHDQLRMDAETRLEDGTAPKSNGSSLGTDTLALLHQLATNPDTASDALKLLHELQVHQVELDLQHDEIKSVEEGIARALSHYQAFYEFAPVAYFVLDFNGMVIEANHAAANLFGVGREDLHNQLIVDYLAPENRTEVSSLIERLSADATSATDVTCQVQSAPGPGGRQKLQILASAPPYYGTGVVLMVVTRLA